MASLAHALSKLKRLENFECHGSCRASSLTRIVATLHETVPQLRSLVVRYAEYENFDLPVTPRNIESLSIDPAMWLASSTYATFFEQDLSCLRKLRIAGQNYILPLITPLMGKLTHLDLYHPTYDLFAATSSAQSFEVVLREGAHLESLRIRQSRPSHTPSIHFRHYSHSLPHLTRFSIAFGSPTSAAEYDRDLFPAICDFLRNKPGLVTVELIAPSNLAGHRPLGYDRKCWGLLSAFSCLRGLSMTLTELGESERCAQLIPRSVTTLALTGDVDFEKVISMDSQAHWPRCVRFLQLDQVDSGRTARRIAMHVPSVHVLRLRGCHYNVVSRVTGKPVQVERWSARTEDYFWSEELEAQGCEDCLLYMFPPSRT